MHLCLLFWRLAAAHRPHLDKEIESVSLAASPAPLESRLHNKTVCCIKAVCGVLYFTTINDSGTEVRDALWMSVWADTYTFVKKNVFFLKETEGYAEFCWFPVVLSPESPNWGTFNVSLYQLYWLLWTTLSWFFSSSEYFKVLYVSVIILLSQIYVAGINYT